MTGIALAVLAVLLSWAAPSALARARWVEHAPRAAVVLWQALALAAVLAAVGAALAAPEEALRAWAGEVEFGDGLLLAVGVADLLEGVDGVWRLGVRLREGS